MRTKIKQMVWLIGLSVMLLGSIVVCESATTKQIVKAQKLAAAAVPDKVAAWTKRFDAESAKLQKRKAVGQDTITDLENLRAKNFRVKDLFLKYDIAVRTHMKVTKAMLQTDNKSSILTKETVNETAKAVADTQKELLDTIDALMAGKDASIAKQTKPKSEITIP